jgi:TPR repeat protein
MNSIIVCFLPKPSTTQKAIMKTNNYVAMLTVAALLGACSKPETPPAADNAGAPVAGSQATARMSEADQNYQDAKRLLDANAADQDLANAVNMLLRSSELGNPNAKVLLARLYREGRGLSANPGEAINLLSAASAAGNAEAAYELGLSFETGTGVEKNPGEAMNNYLAAAQAGNANAMFKAAEAFRTGNGASESMEQAANWYRKAAEAGHPDAAAKLNEIEAK